MMKLGTPVALKVEVEGSAHGDVHDLCTSADPEHRQAAGPGCVQGIVLSAIAMAADPPDQWIGRSDPIGHRVDIASPTEDQAVQALDQVGDLWMRGRTIERQWHSACGDHPLKHQSPQPDLVKLTAAVDDSDDRRVRHEGSLVLLLRDGFASSGSWHQG